MLLKMLHYVFVLKFGYGISLDMHLEKDVHQSGQDLVLLVYLCGIELLELIVSYLAQLPR